MRMLNVGTDFIERGFDDARGMHYYKVFLMQRNNGEKVN